MLGAQLVGLGLTTALAVAFASPASAQQLDPGPQLGSAVMPVEIDENQGADNPSCSDLLGVGASMEVLVEAPEGGTVEDGMFLLGSIDVRQNPVPPGPEGQVADFVLDDGLLALAAIVKGGENANFYDYRPDGIGSDNDLHSPLNPANGQFHDISNIKFCLIEKPYYTPPA